MCCCRQRELSLTEGEIQSAEQRLECETKESRAREMGVGSPKAAAHHPAKQNNKCTLGLSSRRRPPVTLALASHFARRPADRVPRSASSAHHDFQRHHNAHTTPIQHRQRVAPIGFPNPKDTTIRRRTGKSHRRASAPDRVAKNPLRQARVPSSKKRAESNRLGLSPRARGGSRGGAHH